MSGFMKKVAHNPRVSLGPKDMAKLGDVISSEKKLVEAVQRLSNERTKSSISMKEWGNAEGPDLGDVLTKVSILFDYLSTAEKAYADHNERFRLHFKDIRTREEEFAALRKRDEQLGSKIESLEKKVSKMKEENKDLPANLQKLAELRQEKVGLEHSVLNAEASLGDFKRSQARAAMSFKLGALLELAEKTVVLGSIGKLLVDEIQLDRTEPGGQRVYYEGFGRTDQLMSEAQRCIQDVVFNPLSDGLAPQQESPFPPQNGQTINNYDSPQNDYSSRQQHQNEYTGGGVGEDYASPRADYNPYAEQRSPPQENYGGGLAYPQTTLPPIESHGGLMESADDLNPRDFASQARDRSSLAYMTAPASDEDHSIPPPMPVNAAERVAAQTLSPVSDVSESEELGYQRELEQAQHHQWEQAQATRISRRPSDSQRFRYDGLEDSTAQYAPQQTDSTPVLTAQATPETSPMSHSFHPHDKSVEPLVPRWGAPAPAEEVETSISYTAPSKPALYVEERPYVPKPNDGAYHGPSQDPPLSSTSSHFNAGNASRNGSSVGSEPIPAPIAAPTTQSQHKWPAPKRGESALGSKYGDLGSPTIGGVTTPSANTGRFQLGGGATVGAQSSPQSSGYFRPHDVPPSPGGEMELPSQRKVNAGAFRRPQLSSQEVPRWNGYQPGVGSYNNGGGQTPVSPSGRSEAEDIREAYRASAIPVPPTTNRNSTQPRDGSRSPEHEVDRPPRFDVSPLRIDKRASVSAVGAGGPPVSGAGQRQLNSQQSKGSLNSYSAASEVSTNMSPTSYHPPNHTYLSQQVGASGSTGAGAGAGGRGFGGGAYVTKLD